MQVFTQTAVQVPDGVLDADSFPVLFYTREFPSQLLVRAMYVGTATLLAA